jgi:hypothetical protein
MDGFEVCARWRHQMELLKMEQDVIADLLLTEVDQGTPESFCLSARLMVVTGLIEAISKRIENARIIQADLENKTIQFKK